MKLLHETYNLILVTFEVSQKLMSELNEVLFKNKSDILVTSVVQRLTLPLLICEAINHLLLYT